MFYPAWISITMILCVFWGYMTMKANAPDSSWNWVVGLYFVNLLSVWPLIARYSKDVIFDGLLYDVVIFFVFYGTVMAFGATARFTAWQWAGTGVVIIGFLILKLGGNHVN